jgi:hypothetical protein
MTDKSRFWDPRRPGLNADLKNFYQAIEATPVGNSAMWKGINLMPSPRSEKAKEKSRQHWAGRMGLES